MCGLRGRSAPNPEWPPRCLAHRRALSAQFGLPRIAADRHTQFSKTGADNDPINTDVPPTSADIVVLR